MKTLHILLIVLGFGFAQVSSAQSTMASKDTNLYVQMGELKGIELIVDELIRTIQTDSRIKDQFAKTNFSNLKMRLVEQICQVSGGPCLYKGADMKTAHGQLDINKADFHALVEDLQVAMDQQKISFGVQNQLLSKLAPMHRDVITLR
jgi:hemoglobin